MVRRQNSQIVPSPILCVFNKFYLKVTFWGFARAKLLVLQDNRLNEILIEVQGSQCRRQVDLKIVLVVRSLVSSKDTFYRGPEITVLPFFKGVKYIIVGSICGAARYESLCPPSLHKRVHECWNKLKSIFPIA